MYCNLLYYTITRYNDMLFSIILSAEAMAIKEARPDRQTDRPKRGRREG